MADRRAEVLARDAGIDLLLQTEPELARALERSCAPSSSSEGSAATPFGDDEYMLAVELRFTLTALHLQAVSTLRTLAVGGNRRPIYEDAPACSRDAGYSWACSPTETGDPKPEP